MTSVIPRTAPMHDPAWRSDMPLYAVTFDVTVEDAAPQLADVIARQCRTSWTVRYTTGPGEALSRLYKQVEAAALRVVQVYTYRIAPEFDAMTAFPARPLLSDRW